MLAEGRTARQTAAELGLSVKTVEAHKLNLMRKLDVHDRATLIASAIEAGLVPGAAER
jgi:DNA-binding NarL/FixJ family response regulator